VELLRSGRLASDHPDWALGAGFSFTPQDGESEGEAEGDPGEGAPGPGSANAVLVPAAAAPEPGGQYAAHEARLSDRDGGAGARGDRDGGGGTGGAAAARARGAQGGPPQASDGRSEGRTGPAVGVDLEHGFSLASADALATPFTNFVRGRAPPRIQAKQHTPGHRPLHGMHAYLRPAGGHPSPAPMP